MKNPVVVKAEMTLKNDSRKAETLVAGKKQHNPYTNASEYDIKQESAEFLVFQDGEGTPTQREQQQGEVAARQHHENGNHDLGIVGKLADVARPCGEAA